MKPLAILAFTFVIGTTLSCSSSRPTLSSPPATAAAERPAMEPAPTENAAPAGSMETTAPAMEMSAAAEPEMRRFDGLTEYGRGRLRGKKAQGNGRVEVSPSSFSWQSDKEKDRNFTIRGEVVKTATLNCAKRAGENLCLELGIRTLTDNEYYFRDRDWEAGGNTQITALYEYLKGNYPKVVFDEQVVDTIK